MIIDPRFRYVTRPHCGNELITLVNTTAAPVDLTGWTLADAGGGRMPLDGVLTGGAVRQVPAGPAIPLGNQGDTLVLLDPAGATIDRVTYQAAEVRTGRTICVGG